MGVEPRRTMARELMRVPREKQGLEIFTVPIELVSLEDFQKDQGREGYPRMRMQFELMERRRSNLKARIVCLWLIAAAGTAVAGCGQGSFRSGPDYPVKGKVLLDNGKPLRLGRVVFVSSETALSYVGQIGDDGGYELKQGDRVGVPAGSYKVRIEVPETSLPKATGKKPNLPFPPRYRDEDVSKLAATVKAGSEAENTFEFKLTN